jgi:hypothetical protein
MPSRFRMDLYPRSYFGSWSRVAQILSTSNSMFGKILAADALRRAMSVSSIISTFYVYKHTCTKYRLHISGLNAATNPAQTRIAHPTKHIAPHSTLTITTTTTFPITIAVYPQLRLSHYSNRCYHSKVDLAGQDRWLRTSACT